MFGYTCRTIRFAKDIVSKTSAFEKLGSYIAYIEPQLVTESDEHGERMSLNMCTY